MKSLGNFDLDYFIGIRRVELQSLKTTDNKYLIDLLWYELEIDIQPEVTRQLVEELDGIAL